MHLRSVMLSELTADHQCERGGPSLQNANNPVPCCRRQCGKACPMDGEGDDESMSAKRSMVLPILPHNAPGRIGGSGEG